MRIPAFHEFFPPSLYRRAARWGRAILASPERHRKYGERLATEQAIFENNVDVHQLPPIFHYWSNRYLRPKCEGFGFSHPDDFFAVHLARTVVPGRRARFLSIGAGNCDTEVRVAKLLLERGVRDFSVECVDLNEAMLARGRALAAAEGLSGQIITTAADFNDWVPEGRFDAVMANQSLHHVVALEHLFETIARCMAPHALFMASDMIGRNGHQRWPEALAIVRGFWRELPESYRYNLQTRRQESEFVDWDCSVSGFEGIRAQDILRLLVERFEFDLFLPFANVIDPFIDRSFGHHFDPQAEWDRGFIDRVHARDEEEMARGHLTPTHMMAVMCVGRHGEGRFLDGKPPGSCIRLP